MINCLCTNTSLSMMITFLLLAIILKNVICRHKLGCDHSYTKYKVTKART